MNVVKVTNIPFLIMIIISSFLFFVFSPILSKIFIYITLLNANNPNIKSTQRRYISYFTAFYWEGEILSLWRKHLNSLLWLKASKYPNPPSNNAVIVSSFLFFLLLRIWPYHSVWFQILRSISRRFPHPDPTRIFRIQQQILPPYSHQCIQGYQNDVTRAFDYCETKQQKFVIQFFFWFTIWFHGSILRVNRLWRNPANKNTLTSIL